MIYPRVRQLRNEHKLRQEDVGKILHCQRAVYQRYETGIRELPLSYAIILAKYYNVSVDYLLGTSDVKAPFPKRKKKSIWIR